MMTRLCHCLPFDVVFSSPFQELDLPVHERSKSAESTVITIRTTCINTKYLGTFSTEFINRFRQALTLNRLAPGELVRRSVSPFF